MRPGEVSPGRNPDCSPEAFRRFFYNQLQTFRKLFRSEMQLYGKPLGSRSAKLSVGLSFAEELMLCPTEEAALVRIRRDLEAARVIYIIGGDVKSAIDTGYAQFSIQASRDQTPFFALAYVVRAQIQAMIDKGGDFQM